MRARWIDTLPIRPNTSHNSTHNTSHNRTHNTLPNTCYGLRITERWQITDNRQQTTDKPQSARFARRIAPLGCAAKQPQPQGGY